MAIFWVVASLRFIALMMETAKTSETLVNLYQSTRRYNPEDSHLHTHRRENLKSYLLFALNLKVSASPYLHEHMFFFASLINETKKLKRKDAKHMFYLKTESENSS
jgi:hypothetical protein